jgi:AAA family ATP:ADP antiporter
MPKKSLFGGLLSRLVSARPHEIGALLLSCLYFYLLLCAYYIIRPIRNEMLIENGVDNLQWLLLLTMGVMLVIAPLFGWLTSNFKARQFLSYSTLFFVACLLVFFVLFNQPERPIAVTRSFYVWVNVFNMFVVSLFWSFMNDIYSQAQSKRLFAFIAAGGTAGALTGPMITTLLVERIGLSYLLLISAAILSLTIVCSRALLRWHNPDAAQAGPEQAREEPLEGGIFDGITLILKSPYLIGICGFILLFTMLATFLAIQQAELIETLFTDSAQRTKLFAQVDFVTNVLTLFLQLFLTSRIIATLGFRNTLMLLPIGLTLGTAVLAVEPLIAVFIGLEIFRRVGDYAIMKPAREMLFTILGREEKYKAKNFIDTAILRSGDALSAWLYTGFKVIGTSSYGLALIGVGIGVAWTSVAFWLGARYEKKTAVIGKMPNTAA